MSRRRKRRKQSDQVSLSQRQATQPTLAQPPISSQPPLLVTPSEAGPVKQKVVKTSISTTEAYFGPIPPPAMLAEYERLVPGSAKQFLDRLETQSCHRQQMERKHQSHNNARSWGGLVCGTILVLGCVAVSAYAVHCGYPVAGLATVFGSLATLAAVFVYSKRGQDKEVKMKRELTKSKK